MNYPRWRIDFIRILTHEILEDLQLNNIGQSLLYQVNIDFSNKNQKFIVYFPFLRAYEDAQRNILDAS